MIDKNIIKFLGVIAVLEWYAILFKISMKTNNEFVVMMCAAMAIMTIPAVTLLNEKLDKRYEQN